MDVIQELTGIDFNALGKQQKAEESNSEEARKKAEEERQRREAEAAAKKKAAEEAAMPSEERDRIKRAKEAENIKLKGNEFYKKKEFDQALRYYNEALDMNPDEVIYYSNIGACYIEMKQYDAAIEYCDKGIASTKGRNYDFVKLAKVMARKASALEKNGQMDEALEVYRKALLENSDPTIKTAMKTLEK